MMARFLEKLKLKEMAEEDIYFAKRDVEIIKALREEKLKKLIHKLDDKKRRAASFEKKYKRINKKHKKDLSRRAKAYRKLIDKIRKYLKV